MSGLVLFKMSEWSRQSLIKRHLFYVEEAQKRLLSQFDDMETDAKRAADEWLDKNAQYFDPERHDPSDFDEAAYDVGIEFYSLLSDMREQTRLSVVAGMFHDWDKKLREWLAREVSHWHQGHNTKSKIWSVNLGEITDLLESIGWRLRGGDYFNKLDACRLVVNVYKHGEGNSLDELRDKYPEYLADPFNGAGGLWSGVKYRDHTHLKVSDDQFQAFSDAILSFWRGVPENVMESEVTEVPDWFGKAMLKDNSESQQASKK